MSPSGAVALALEMGALGWGQAYWPRRGGAGLGPDGLEPKKLRPEPGGMWMATS